MRTHLVGVLHGSTVQNPYQVHILDPEVGRLQAKTPVHAVVVQRRETQVLVEADRVLVLGRDAEVDTGDALVT